MLDSFRAAAHEYGRAVEAEAARLIRAQGVPPWEALERAQRRLAARRLRERRAAPTPPRPAAP
jgi:plasmid stability protein